MTQTKEKTYFRSIEELDGTPEFEQFLNREFADIKAEFPPDGVSRRRWLQIMGASLSLGGVALAGCRFQNEEIAPFPFRPADFVPGTTTKYATSVEWGGYTRPLLCTKYDGRPIKVDGNPDHPESMGASDAITQAMVLSLYDPDRSRNPLEAGRESNWTKVVSALSGTTIDASFAILCDPSTSPTLNGLKEKLVAKGAKWYEYASITNDNERAGLKAAFGKNVVAVHDFSKAKRIVCLDADPFATDNSSLKNSRGWAEMRDPDHDKMNRVYSIESQFSVTGSNADHRWPVKSSLIGGLALELLKAIKGTPSASGESWAEVRLALIAEDLKLHGGSSLVVCGANQPAEVHAIVAQINDELGNVGATITYIDDPRGDSPSCLDQMKSLVGDMSAGKINTMLVINANPIYDAPAELGFGSAFAKVKNRVHLSNYYDETGRACQWHLNKTHVLEEWGDSLAADGSWCVSQPMIEPLFESKSAVGLLSLLLGEKASDMEMVKASASKSLQGEKAWKELLRDGWLSGSAAKPVDVSAKDMSGVKLPGGWNKSAASVEEMRAASSYELVFMPSRQVFDGRFANSGWLQEMPDPITKMVWGNAAFVDPLTAKAIGVSQGQLLKVTAGGGTVKVPVFIQPGNAIGSIGVMLGYGRKAAGVVGGMVVDQVAPVGVDVTGVRSVAQWDIVPDCVVMGTKDTATLYTTQDHHAIDSLGKREIVKRQSHLIELGDFSNYESWKEQNKEEIAHHGHDEHGHDENGHGDHSAEAAEGDSAGVAEKEHEGGHGHHLHWPVHTVDHPENISLTPNTPYTKDHKWGMGIDLTKCIACNGCVIACQAENNIPVVGPDQVSRGREMHWMRIDRYLAADAEYMDDPIMDPEPEIQTQPVTCQQCEKAPCEQVCPVAATVHSHEGLNDMVYNRCIGTRYCGNNCPFKVRRFNYFNYSDADTFIKYPWADKLSDSDRSLQNLAMNPEVSIRSRGVMEKCTYCTQRISAARITAKVEGKKIGCGDDDVHVTTACQDACPTGAITFGDLSEEGSPVAEAHESFRAYRMLDYLNIGQRTKYLARVQNLNPKWPKRAGGTSGDDIVAELEVQNEVYEKHHGEH